MTKEELFELKKEITLIKDFAETDEYKESVGDEEDTAARIEGMEQQLEDGFVKLDETAQKWVNEKYVYWLDIYMLRQSRSGGCSSCSGGGCSN